VPHRGLADQKSGGTQRPGKDADGERPLRAKPVLSARGKKAKLTKHRPVANVDPSYQKLNNKKEENSDEQTMARF